MKTKEYLRAKLEPELRRELEEKSKEELIDAFIDLTFSYCVDVIHARITNNQQPPSNPFPDWSKAIFEGAAQCCTIRTNLINNNHGE